MEVDGVHQKKRKSGANVEAAAAEAEEAGAKPKQERKAPDFSQRILFRCPIACPLMEKSKSYKKLFKLVKKANKQKLVRKGVREVQKYIRKGEKGMVVLAADTSPVDIISHLPIVCEDAGIPYVFVRSKKELGLACSSKRAMCTLLIKTDASYQSTFDKTAKMVNGLRTEQEEARRAAAGCQ